MKPSSFLPPSRSHRGITTHLDVLLRLNPKVALATWMSNSGTAIVDLLSIPDDQRRRGLGTMIYRAWERQLAEGTLVELFAIDAGARAFWSSLGFKDVGQGGMEKRIEFQRPLALQPDITCSSDASRR